MVIVGDRGAADTETMLAALRGEYVPNKVVLLKPDESEPDISKIAGFTASQVSLGGSAAAYVCRDFECELPTADPAKMLELLGVGRESDS